MRPRVGVSACLLGERVRYDGGHRRERWLVDVLGRHVEWVPVCPEVEVGLGVPRPTIELQRRGRAIRLIEPSTGRDLTDDMDGWADTRLGALARAGLDGFVLKARSPSCGAWSVAVHGARGGETPTGRGRFAAALMAALPRLAVADEDALRDPDQRAGFCERVFASRRLRELWRARWRVTDLREFHLRHAGLLTARDPDRARVLDRLVAQATDRARRRVRLLYTHGFLAAMARPLTRARRHARLSLAAAALGPWVDARARAALRSLLARYARGTVTSDAVQRILRRHAAASRLPMSIDDVLGPPALDS